METCKTEDLGQIAAIESWRIMGGKEPVFSNMQPACVAISPDGERVAVALQMSSGVFMFLNLLILSLLKWDLENI